jgi:hypothetical protein
MNRVTISAVVLVSLVAVARAADQFETPPTLKAADAAPATLVKGDGFRIDDAVPTDGLTTRFQLRSDVGNFEVHGVETLAIRVSELPALRELANASKTGAFTTALAETAKRPVKAATEIITSPVETAKGIPSGLGRFFDRVGSGGKRIYDTVTDDKRSGTERGKEAAAATGQATADAFGLEQERRKLAKQLGVDPYTSNPVLAKKLDEFSKAAFYGRVGMNTLISVVVPASILITGTSVTRDLVYDTPRGDLIVRNEEALRGMGVGDASVRALQRSPGFTLSQQTALVKHLQALDGVKGRPDVVALAATASTADQAMFMVRAVRMLAEAHKQHRLVELDAAGTVFARDGDGTLIVPGPVDYVSWTQRVARFAARPDLKAPAREVQITGRMTPRAKAGFEKLGWTVVENTR